MNTNINNQIEMYLIQALEKGEVNLSGLSKQTAEQVLDLLARMSIVKARDDFYTFVKVMADELIPTGFVDGRHIKLIAWELQEVEQSIKDAFNKKIKHAKRKQFFLPPGAMKSLLISVLFVCWFLGRNPKFRVLQLGHSTDFAIDNFGRKVRDIINTSDKFKAIFPDCKLKADTRSAQRFDLTKGGGYITAGAGAQIAGKRGHLLICDDVLSEQTAFSDVERGKINRWYLSGARSRMLPASAEVIVNTRWHIDDLSAYLEKIDSEGVNPWKIVSIPAILDEKGSKLLGLPIGHSYWPEYYPDEYFFAQRASYISAGEAARWSALFMQNPVPEEGNLVKREHIAYWDKPNPPLVDLVVISIDTAYETTKRADFSAITVWGVFKTRCKGHNGHEYVQNNIILLDAKRGKWELHDLIKEIKDAQEEYEADWVLIEKKASGISVIQELRRDPSIPLFEYVPDRDKMSRLQSALPTFKAKCVWFPSNQPYSLEVITELLQFPAAKNDDFVDTCSLVINWMRMNLILARPGEIGYDDGEEDDEPTGRPNTYWGALQK